MLSNHRLPLISSLNSLLLSFKIEFDISNNSPADSKESFFISFISSAIYLTLSNDFFNFMCIAVVHHFERPTSAMREIKDSGQI